MPAVVLELRRPVQETSKEPESKAREKCKHEKKSTNLAGDVVCSCCLTVIEVKR